MPPPSPSSQSLIFFSSAPPTTEIYTLSLHDALPISHAPRADAPRRQERGARVRPLDPRAPRSEEHTSELQSQFHLVCRLLLEKKNFLIGFFSILSEHGVAAVIVRRPLHQLRHDQ